MHHHPVRQGNRIPAFCHFGIALLLAISASPTVEAQQAEKLFKLLDKNGDGLLTVDELPPRLQQLFDAVDTSGNGRISLDEHGDFLTEMRETAERRLRQSVDLTRDIPYAAGDNPRQRLDLLLPKERTSGVPLPVIAFIHGGAWRHGDRTNGMGILFPLVRTGNYAGVSIGYRLTDEAQWPSQLHDCKAAIRWIRGHAKEYGLDANKIGVIGTSAGGHLVSMLGVSHGLTELEGDLGDDDDESTRVTCVVNMFGPSDLLTIGDDPSRMNHRAPDSPESLLIGGPVPENMEKAKSASPIAHVTKDDSPFLHVHGTADPLVPFAQSERFHAAITKAGVPSLLLEVTGGMHGNFNSREIDDRIHRFFDRHLLGKEVNVSSDAVRVGPEN